MTSRHRDKYTARATAIVAQMDDEDHAPQLLSFVPAEHAIVVDLDRLVTSRMLVQANSGGGKSRALRYLLEQTYGKLPHLVIDPEGEFSSLREQFAYVLVGQDGDIPAILSTAGHLTRRLIELGASAILDLYELSLEDRALFVKEVLETLIRLPRALWRPLLVVIDEAHQFAPETSAGASASRKAVIDLCVLGRKRGFGAVLATQRLSKLHKDAADLNNMLIGRTALDIDVQRAGAALGFDNERRRTLRKLPPGHFYAFGPAVSDEVVLVRTGSVVTTHPEPGTITPPAPPLPEVLRGLIAQLNDLATESDTDARTASVAQQRISEREQQLVQQSAALPKIERMIERVEVPVVSSEQVTQLTATVQALAGTAEQLTNLASMISAALGRIHQSDVIAPEHLVPEQAKDTTSYTVDTPAAEWDVRSPDVQREHDKPALRAGERRILETLGRHHLMKMTRAQLGTLSHFTPSGGTFSTYLSALKRHILISEQHGEIAITATGLAYLGATVPQPQTTEEILQMWRSALRAGERKLLDELVRVYPRSLRRDDLGERTGYTASGGTFTTYLGTLRRNGLIETDDNGVRASATLFLGHTSSN